MFSHLIAFKKPALNQHLKEIKLMLHFKTLTPEAFIQNAETAHLFGQSIKLKGRRRCPFLLPPLETYFH